MGEPHRILIVADTSPDSGLAQHEVHLALPGCAIEQAQAEGYAEALERFQPALVVAVCWRPALDGMAVLGMAAARPPAAALIVITDEAHEDAAIACIEAGAADYVLLEHIRRLGIAARRVVAERQLYDERGRAEETRAQLEQQLRQAQKMESIGQLAGGIAHDFNNLLTVIQGYCDLMEAETTPGSALREDLGQIRLASQRASAMTRQLLAFSRRQVLSPEVVALNDLVMNVLRMLERLIGEDIALVTSLAADLHPVIADAGQIEQVIVNLVLNARDAMPTGGTLVIETSNVSIEPGHTSGRPDGPAGPCVLLTVSDTGYGMESSTRERIFEPFFTTKAPGKGTGLGLATAYGIIRQSGGEISVRSQPAQGAAFQIVLPASPQASGGPADAAAPAPATGGSETILLVEDDPLVRQLLRAVLQREGYRILEAAGGLDGLEVARQHQGPIDLLISDVVMPQVDGYDLAGQLCAARPSLRVLFISGYSHDADIKRGLPTGRVHTLSKPFSATRLAARVRELLDEAAPDAAAEQPAGSYYEDVRSSLLQTLTAVDSAAKTRSFAQASLAQGNVLGMMGDFGAAGEQFARGLATFQALGDRGGQAMALERLGWIAREQGEAARAMALLEESVGLSRRIGDRQQIAWALLTIAGVAIMREDAAGAEALIDQALALNPESHDWVGWSYNHQGQIALLRHEYDHAAHLYQRSMTVFVDRLGDQSTGVMWAYLGLGQAALGQGDAALARRWLLDGLRLSQRLGARAMIAWCMAGLGNAAAVAEEPERAARLWGSAERLRASLGCRSAPAARAVYERLLAITRIQLGLGPFETAWEEGRALPLERAIADALGA